MSRAKRCAACGGELATKQATTFLVDRTTLNGEFHLCEPCWSEGENNEVWNERITQRIIARQFLNTAKLIEGA